MGPPAVEIWEQKEKTKAKAAVGVRAYFMPAGWLHFQTIKK
jgi:hypothetical protein